MRVQEHCQKRQTPKPTPDAPDLSLQRVPAPLHRHARKKQNLSVQARPRDHLHIQPRSLSHGDPNHSPQEISPRHPGTDDQLLDYRIPTAHDLRSPARKQESSILTQPCRRTLTRRHSRTTSQAWKSISRTTSSRKPSSAHPNFPPIFIPRSRGKRTTRLDSRLSLCPQRQTTGSGMKPCSASCWSMTRLPLRWKYPYSSPIRTSNTTASTDSISTSKATSSPAISIFSRFATGHIHILDYKPEARKEKHAHVQLTIYALALREESVCR